MKVRTVPLRVPIEFARALAVRIRRTKATSATAELRVLAKSILRAERAAARRARPVVPEATA